VESNWVHSALQSPTGLLCQPRVTTIMEKLVEWWLAGEIEVLGENLLQCRFAHHKPRMLPGSRAGKPATNRLSYGTAIHQYTNGDWQADWRVLILPAWTTMVVVMTVLMMTLHRHDDHEHERVYDSARYRPVSCRKDDNATCITVPMSRFENLLIA
jgi:hypothetical protein